MFRQYIYLFIVSWRLCCAGVQVLVKSDSFYNFLQINKKGKLIKTKLYCFSHRKDVIALTLFFLYLIILLFLLHMIRFWGCQMLIGPTSF